MNRDTVIAMIKQHEADLHASVSSACRCPDLSPAMRQATIRMSTSPSDFLCAMMKAASLTSHPFLSVNIRRAHGYCRPRPVRFPVASMSDTIGS